MAQQWAGGQHQGQFGVSVCGRGAAEGGAEGEEQHQEAAGVRGEHLHHVSVSVTALWGLWLFSVQAGFLYSPHPADVRLCVHVRVHVCERESDDDDDVCCFRLMTRSLYFPLLHKVPL